MSASKQAAELDKCTIFSKTKNPYWVLQWPWCHFRLLQLCTNNLKPILLLLVSKQLIAMHKCNTDGTQKQHNVIWGPSQYITEEGPISPANTAEWLVSTLRIIFNINPLLCWCLEGFFLLVSMLPLVRIPPGHLPSDVFYAFPAGRRTGGRLRRCWRDYSCHLALPKSKIFRGWSRRRVVGRWWNYPTTRC